MREFLRPRGRPDEDDEMTWDGEAGEAAAPDAVTSPADLGSVGEHIATVLAAAEAAAAKLRTDTEDEAKRLHQEAEHDADEIRGRAKQEAQRERASARTTLEDAERASASVRSDADLYANDRRRDADAQAADLVLEAQRRAAAVADSAEERHRVVLTNIATSEARLRDLAASLRSVAATLDEVVGEGPAQAKDADDADGNLEEALHPARARRAEEAAHT